MKVLLGVVVSKETLALGLVPALAVLIGTQILCNVVSSYLMDVHRPYQFTT